MIKIPLILFSKASPNYFFSFLSILSSPSIPTPLMQTPTLIPILIPLLLLLPYLLILWLLPCPLLQILHPLFPPPPPSSSPIPLPILLPLPLPPLYLLLLLPMISLTLFCSIVSNPMMIFTISSPSIYCFLHHISLLPPPPRHLLPTTLISLSLLPPLFLILLFLCLILIPTLVFTFLSFTSLLYSPSSYLLFPLHLPTYSLPFHFFTLFCFLLSTIPSLLPTYSLPFHFFTLFCFLLSTIPSSPSYLSPSLSLLYFILLPPIYHSLFTFLLIPFPFHFFTLFSFLLSTIPSSPSFIPSPPPFPFLYSYSIINTPLPLFLFATPCVSTSVFPVPFPNSAFCLFALHPFYSFPLFPLSLSPPWIP